MVVSLSRRWGFDDGGAGRIALAVDEAMTNVVRHGYKGNREGLIEIHMAPLRQSECLSGTGIRIVIEDRGESVDPATIQPRDLEEVRPGGLGVHIIREVMDAAEYSCRDGGGMRLTLCKDVARDGEA